VDTYTHNVGHPGYCLDIRDLRGKVLAKVCPDRPDWVVGGPPCQGYSTVGRRDPSDIRNRLFIEFKRVVTQLQPEGFLIENVLGLKDMSFEMEVKHELERDGYTVEFLMLRAADFGVPQLRRRVVFVGRRDGTRFMGPTKSHLPQDYLSVADAISDLPPLEPGEASAVYTTDPLTPYQKILRDACSTLTSHVAAKHPVRLVEAISHIPDGGNRQDIPDSLQPPSGYHNSYSRLASWLPAVAVTQNMSKPSGTRCIHPFQHRGLTAREGARLQSFPDRFTFLHGQVSQRLQIANAVPPILAQALGEALVDPYRWW
jgi:DNA (cytosine-5)-methyltransferase 1